MATKLEGGGGIGEALVAGPLKTITFFAASRKAWNKDQLYEDAIHACAGYSDWKSNKRRKKGKINLHG